MSAGQQISLTRRPRWSEFQFTRTLQRKISIYPTNSMNFNLPRPYKGKFQFTDCLREFQLIAFTPLFSIYRLILWISIYRDLIKVNFNLPIVYWNSNGCQFTLLNFLFTDRFDFNFNLRFQFTDRVPRRWDFHRIQFNQIKFPIYLLILISEFQFTAP